jgi:hypothetical protein
VNLEKKWVVVCLVIVVFGSVFGLIERLSTRRPIGEEYKTLAEQLQSEARREIEKIRGVVVTEVNLEVVNQSWVAENWRTPIDSTRDDC